MLQFCELQHLQLPNYLISTALKCELKWPKSLVFLFKCLLGFKSKLQWSQFWGPIGKVLEFIWTPWMVFGGILKLLRWSKIYYYFRHTCLQSHLQTSPPTPQKSYPKFRDPRTTFEIFKKKLKMPPQGAMGGLQICWGVHISFFCKKKKPVKFQNSN